MNRQQAERIVEEAEKKGKAESIDFIVYYDNKWKTFSLYRKKGYTSNFNSNKGFLIEYLMATYKKYAIIYNSKMTDISIYFISNNKDILKKYSFALII